MDTTIKFLHIDVKRKYLPKVKTIGEIIPKFNIIEEKCANLWGDYAQKVETICLYADVSEMQAMEFLKQGIKGIIATDGYAKVKDEITRIDETDSRITIYTQNNPAGYWFYFTKSDTRLEKLPF